MATNDSTEKRQLSAGDLEQIERDLRQAGMMFASILEWATETQAEVNLTALEAMAEKGGYLTDRCQKLFGTGGIHGTFDCWANLDLPAAEAEADAQVTA